MTRLSARLTNADGCAVADGGIGGVLVPVRDRHTPGRRASDWGLRVLCGNAVLMGRLTIDLPADLGGRAATAERDRAEYQRANADEATRTFVDWVDCWASG